MLSHKIITLAIMKGITITIRMIKLIIKGMKTAFTSARMTTITDVEYFKVEADTSEIRKIDHACPSSATLS